MKYSTLFSDWTRVLLCGIFILLLFGCADNAEINSMHSSSKASEEEQSPATRIRRLLLQYPSRFLAAIEDDISAFTKASYALLEQETPPLILVDKSHRLAADYHPPNLEEFDDIKTLHTSKSGMLGSTEALAALQAMSAEMDLSGLKLRISSAYRSFSYQKGLYERGIAREGYAATAASIAPPGASEHQLGTTFDFGDITLAFADTKESAWLEEHAHEYGFVLSYPDTLSWLTGYMYEPWHYRYIGAEAANFSKQYFDGILFYTLHFLKNAAIQLP